MLVASGALAASSGSLGICQTRDQHVHQRADADHERDGADAYMTAEGESDGHDERLQERTHETHGVTALRQPDHDPVARTGAEPGADVQP